MNNRIGWGLALVGFLAFVSSTWLSFEYAMSLLGFGSLFLLAGAIVIRLAKQDEES